MLLRRQKPDRSTDRATDRTSTGSARLAHSWAADIGPGLITAASDNDPSGLATYTLAGAWYGFDLLWVCVLTYPSTVALQLIASRVAAITGLGLTANMRKHDSPLFFYFAVARFLIANTFNIAVDVLAMGIALRVFCGGSLAWLTLLSGGASLLLQWLVPYARYAQALKWLTLALFAYVGVMVVVDVPWRTVAFRLFVPRVVWDEGYMGMLIAVLGTTISPYLLFAQAEQEAKDMDAGESSRREALNRKMAHVRRNTLVRTALSNVVSICVMIAAAATLHLLHRTPAGATVSMAGVLAPLAHGYAAHVLALALFGSAALALPPLAGSAAQAVASAFERQSGERRDRQLSRPVVGLMVVGVAGAVGLAIHGVEPARALYWSALLNGMTITPVLVLLVLLSTKHEAVGDLAAHWSLRVLAWIATLATAAAIIAHVVLEFM